MPKRIPIKADLDLENNRIINAAFEISDIDLIYPVAGSYYFNTDLSNLRVYTGSKWISVGSDTSPIWEELNKKENKENKLTSIPPSITPDQYPNLQLVLSLLDEKQDSLPNPPSLDPNRYFLSGAYTWEIIDTLATYESFYYYIDEIHEKFPQFKKITRYPYLTQSTIEFEAIYGDNLVGSYLMAQILDTDMIFSGVWRFSMDVKVLNTVEGVKIGFEPFIFNPSTQESEVIFKEYTGIFDFEEFNEIQLKVPKILLSVPKTSFIGVNIYIHNVGSASSTIQYRIGGDSKFYLDLPIHDDHSIFRNLNADENFQHIDQEDRTKLDNLSGINTGDILVASIQGSQSGSNDTYKILEEFVPGSLEIYLNGVMQSVNKDYTESSDGFKMLDYNPVEDDVLYVKYKPIY